MIKPTIGRIVYFWPEVSEREKDPLAAIITKVWDDRCINAAIFDVNGNTISDPPTSIILVQPEDERPLSGSIAEWMPYQVKKPIGSESGEKEVGTQSI